MALTETVYRNVYTHMELFTFLSTFALEDLFPNVLFGFDFNMTQT